MKEKILIFRGGGGRPASGIEREVVMTMRDVFVLCTYTTRTRSVPQPYKQTAKAGEERKGQEGALIDV